MRGRRLLGQLDVVVVDRLAPTGLLAELAPDVEVIDVGKMPDHHPIPQDEINRILIERAKAGKIVVRLKGGDPYVFGRGGEERLACEKPVSRSRSCPGVADPVGSPAAASP